jgi:predicted permease
VTALVDDLRTAARGLIRHWRYTLLVVATVAGGIALASGSFGFVYATYLRPPPWHEPAKVMSLALRLPPREARERLAGLPVDGEPIVDAGLMSSSAPRVLLVGGRWPEWVPASAMEGRLMSLLGGKPVLGRALGPEDDRPGAKPVVVLLEPLWRRAFASDPHVVGKTVKFEGQLATVVGVMPARFTGERGPALLAPLALFRDLGPTRIVVRLREALSPDEATARLRARDSLSAAVRPPVLLPYPPVARLPDVITLFLFFPFLLLVASGANVAALSIARALDTSRQRILQLTLGATPLRLVRIAAFEALLLGIVAGVPGVLLAQGLVATVMAGHPWYSAEYGSAILRPTESVGVLLGTLTVTALAGVLPALRLARSDLTVLLKRGDRRSTGASGRLRAWRVLVAVQLALACTLVVSGAALARQFLAAPVEKKGDDRTRNDLLAVTVNVPAPAAATGGTVWRHAEAIRDRVRQVPGVQEAGLADPGGVARLFAGAIGPWRVSQSSVGAPLVYYYGPGFLELWRPKVLQGGLPSHVQQDPRAPFVVLDALAAKYLFGEDSPVGRDVLSGRFRYSWSSGEVAAVVDAGRSPNGIVLYPLFTMSLPADLTPSRPRLLTLILRSRLSPEVLLPTLRQALTEVHPEQALEADSLTPGSERSRDNGRALALLLLSYSLAALLVALIGVHAVMSQYVASRRGELAIRLALGAAPRHVHRMLIAQVARIVVAGVACGAPLAFVLGQRVLHTVAPEASLHVPTAVAAMSLIALGAVATAMVAGRRATRLEPMAVLRAE